MNNLLADQDVRLTYLRDPFAIEALDQEQIVRDLLADLPQADPARVLEWQLLTEFDHVALAYERHSDRCLALLGARDRTTTREEFLHIGFAFVVPAARRRRLMRRMVALTLLRVAGESTVPLVIAARTSDPRWYQMMQSLSRRFTGARLFPDTENAAINLRTAALAQRIAREIGPNIRYEPATGALRGGLVANTMVAYSGAVAERPLSKDPSIEALFGQRLAAVDQMLTVLDLREETETVIIDDARRVYRAR
jgi:hypothetical protein